MALKNANDGSVLEMISYLDEVIPGNALQPDNGPKTWAIYITCKDLPQWMLQLEDCWLCVAVIRTGIASGIDGSVSSCMRCLLEHFIRDCSMSLEGGSTLQLREPTFVFFQFSKYIADEAALSRLWSTKTAAGVVPCIRCLNCVSIKYANGCSLVDISCSDVSKFRKRTHNDACNMHDSLLAKKACLKWGEGHEYENNEKASGLTPHKFGMLGSSFRDCFDIQGTLYDPQHCVYAGGIASNEIWKFMGIARTQFKDWKKVPVIDSLYRLVGLSLIHI